MGALHRYTLARLARLFIVFGILLKLCACSTLPQGSMMSLQRGPGADFVAEEVEKYAASQEKVRNALAAMAGIRDPAGISAPAQWDSLIDAGMAYSDSRCRSYMAALYRLDRDRRTTVAQIGLVGTAAAGLMAAAKAAAREVAVVAILFGLAATTVDTQAGNVLYELPPSTVESMVRAQQLAFRQTLQRGYQSWPVALGVIQNYAVICVPSNIENEINLAVKQTKAGTDAGNPKTGQPPAVSNGIAVSTGEFGMDSVSQLLLGFVRPQGIENPANRAKLQAYLDAKEDGIAVGSLIAVNANAPARLRAARAMNLIP